MKSAFVTASVSRNAGGLFFSVRSLARCMEALMPGDVSVFGLHDEFTTEDLGVWGKLQPSTFPTVGPRSLGYSPALSKTLAACDCEVLHTQGIWQAISAAVHGWHQATGRPYLISPRGMLDPWAVAQSRWKKRVVSMLYESAHLRDAACIHALCESEADSIRAYGLKNPVCVIPNGVDLPQIPHNPEPITDHRPKVLLFLGRLHPKKGLVNAIRAWHAHLQSTIRDPRSSEWTFAIAGWDQGGHEAELKQLCDELGLAWADVPAAEFVGPRCGVLGPSSLVELDESQGASQAHDPPMNPSEAPVHDRPRTKDQGPRTATPVAFLGPVFGEAKDQLLQRASAFLLPSFSEGLPMAVLEAMAYRLPVVMTDACNLPEAFAADAAIRIGTDVESITEGMRQVQQSSIHDLLSLGNNGRALVEQQFTWPQVAAQMKEVYDWVLGGGAKPNCIR